MNLNYSVAISGKTAFVGFPDANEGYGAVVVYEQNEFGVWEKVEDPFIRDAGFTYDHNSKSSYYFGQNLDIDGDLACVGDSIFRKDGNRWVQIDRIDGPVYGDRALCSIAGDTIAIDIGRGRGVELYKYNTNLDGRVPLQDPIPTGTGWDLVSSRSLDLSRDYLVYTGDLLDIVIYRWEETNQTFVLLQQPNVYDPDLYTVNQLALDKDILILGRISNTHVFSEKNGIWEETITLNQSYDSYQLTGRTTKTISVITGRDGVDDRL